ncbi:bidirectional sugar transporter SWEET16-like [Camellia sinensis]|uniref:bidirectional sugar transporter SWEET16-like n=1 Tax=Camellia sinensis TaxID=4442 RepID=UPI0010362C24|nr:bidirectional sugar transporter SWEET16-like [Camellia sinensis]
MKKKSTENYDGLPYITTLLTISLWTLYGILDPDDGILITTVNSVGVVSQLLYVCLSFSSMLLFTPIFAKFCRQVKSMSLLGILVGVLGTVIAVTRLAFHGSARRTFVGVLCATLTIVMYMLHVLKSCCSLLVLFDLFQIIIIIILTGMKSMEYMPFFPSFSLFLYVSVWFTFSMLVKDNYVLVPNAVGIVLGLAQLIVYMIYKNKSSLSILKSMSAEEGIKMQDFENDDEA